MAKPVVRGQKAMWPSVLAVQRWMEESRRICVTWVRQVVVYDPGKKGLKGRCLLLGL